MTRITKIHTAQTSLIAVLLAGIYYSTYAWLTRVDWARDDYSHGILIPFIVLYLIWEKKEAFYSTPSDPTWKGFLLFVPGLLLFWLGELAGEFFVLYTSSWLILMGICWAHWGYPRLKTLIFPLALLPAMFPLPSFLNVKLTFQLRLLSSKLGLDMLHLLGISAYREGNIIDLGFTRLQVVDACSGLRYLFPMLVLSILIAYFSRTAPWKKLLIVASSIPLTILTNALRIALTGVLAMKYGNEAIEGFLHDFEGWLIFMVTLGGLLAEIWIINRLFPEPTETTDEKGKISSTPRNEPVLPKSAGLPQFVATIVLLGGTLLLSYGVDFRENIPMARPLSDFPMQVDSWSGTSRTMETRFIDALDFTDYVMADYTGPTGRGVSFYLAYYQSQQKGESIHSPASCLRGGGWEFKQSGRVSVPMDSGETLSVNRALIDSGNTRQIAYYWFPSRGRNLTNAVEMKWFNFWDALTRQRTDGALVRLIAYHYPDETIGDTEDRLRNFLRQIVPEMNRFLPGR